MKILYIDPVSPRGHVRFNRIQINSLKNVFDCEVSVVCSDYMSRELKDCTDGLIYAYKEIRNNLSMISARSKMLLIQWTIFFKIDFSLYDAVVFAYYDSIVFWLTPFRCHNMFVFNHINVHELVNTVKRFCVKRITKHCTHLVFNEYMREGMKKWGITNVSVIPHGFEKIEYIAQPAASKYIFCPSETSADNEFIKSVVSSDDMKSFLVENNLQLVVKGKFESDCPNITFIRTFQPMNEYLKTFQGAWLVLLAYNDRTDYRCSGVLNECFSMNKPCIVNDCKNFRVYENYFSYDPFFIKEVGDLILKIRHLLIGENFSLGYNNLEEQDPVFFWSKNI